MISRGIYCCLVAGCMVGSAAASVFATEPEMLPGFRRAGELEEQERWTRLETGVRVYVNAPLELKHSSRQLVIYGTPNGNTIEQTLGCAMAANGDWHFD